MTSSEKSLSIVLPAYNEEASIRDSVQACLEFLREGNPGGEVIVVDDGSQDATADVVAEMARDAPELVLVRHQENRGYGRAIDTGFRTARSEMIFFTDADGQFDVREIRDLVPLLETHDVVFGFRVYRYDSVLRCFLSWVYNRLVRVLFRVKVRDVDCSFKLFRREVIDRLVLECDDFFIDTEIVARCARMGVRIVEKGVRHYPRKAGHTTVRPSHIPRTLLTVARMWFRIHFGRTPQRDESGREDAALVERPETSQR